MPGKRKRPVIETLASTRSRRHPRQPGPELDPEPGPGAESQPELVTNAGPLSGVEAESRSKLQLQFACQPHDEPGSLDRGHSNNGHGSDQIQSEPKQNELEGQGIIDGPGNTARPSLIVVLRVRVPPREPEPQSQPSQKPQDSPIENVNTLPDVKKLKLRLKRLQPPGSETTTGEPKKLRCSPRLQPPKTETQIENTEDNQDEAKAYAKVQDTELDVPSTSSTTIAAPPSSLTMVTSIAQSAIVVPVYNTEPHASLPKEKPVKQPPEAETQNEIASQDDAKAVADVREMQINTTATTPTTIVASPAVPVEDTEPNASSSVENPDDQPTEVETRIENTGDKDEAKNDADVEYMQIDTPTTSLNIVVEPPSSPTTLTPTPQSSAVTVDGTNPVASPGDKPTGQLQPRLDSDALPLDGDLTERALTTVAPTLQPSTVDSGDVTKPNASPAEDKPTEHLHPRLDSDAFPLHEDPIEEALTVPDPNTPEIIRSLAYSGPRRPRTQLAHYLPPLHKLSGIFESLTKRAMDLGLGDFLDHLGGRRLRVATVCSGTESPLLALEMVNNSLKKYCNRDLDFDHLFSAEIVPFKQAYIERNFRPRLLFRDVAELQNSSAQTAYGSHEPVPKDADILIAGFSCVDFSGLNNYRKSLEEKGESGDTFWGIVCYAKAYRPRMVILENVKTAPWATIEKHWNDIDYIVVHMNVDTKAYYLPQTRERGYMFCVDRLALPDMARSQLEAGMKQTWKGVFEQFKRPASSPAGMFLLDADDRRLEQIEGSMAQKLTAAAASARATVNWDLYQVRHQGYRLKNGLGHRRPISKWQDDGTCKMPDFAWQTWVRSLPERVWDTIDANFLRKLVDGYDMNYKERCLELSQGIDREMDSRAFGIVGCITPCGIPYMTTRGGPLCGLESLSLQGLPLDRLLLTQESQRELQDLAGNAMSSTVVGAAILSALIAGYKVLKPKEQEKNDSSQESEPNPQAREYKLEPHDKDSLIPSNMYLHSDTTVDILKLQEQAASSARYCTCEGQSLIRTTILKCSLCSHTACSKCSGNPQHVYKRWTDLVRTSPLDFVSLLRSILPARLVVRGITPECYKELRSNSCIPSETWSVFLDAVSKAVGDELRIFDIKRSETWTVTYEGKYSILKLVIDSLGSITWLLFAKPGENEPALCLIREILEKPIARMVVPSVHSGPGSILGGGIWEICTPLSASCSLGLFGSGFQLDSYEAKCGLKAFQGTQVWSQIMVQGTEEDIEGLEVDVRGTYELLQDCGTANASLHRRISSDGKPAIYLFLDPTKLGEPKHDSFVFALEHRRNPGYAARLSIAEICHEWRSAKASDKAEIVTVYHRKWVACPSTSLQPYAGESNRFIQCFSLNPRASLSISDDKCHTENTTLLKFTIPADATALNSGSSAVTDWEVIIPVESPEILREHAWLFQKATGYSDFEAWDQIANPSIHGPCMVCVPPKPRIEWGRDAKLRIKAYEDRHDAARYERAIKTRPPAFLIFRKKCGQKSASDLAELRVTLNIQTLLHQAYSKLPDAGPDTTDTPVSFYWRLVPNSYDVRGNPYPKFVLRSNKNDAPYPNPPKFQRHQLRPEQLRSLSWMVAQEAEDVEPFIEEETEEALLEQLMWRAEGKVTMPKTVWGGILADDVGYGKTAIVLGLIDALSKKSEVNLSVGLNKAGFIRSRATLIVVPRIMMEQWSDEIIKFLGDKYDVLAFSSAAALRKTPIQNIRNADIILVSWSIFDTQAYYKHLQQYTGASEVPDKPGRNFNDWFHHAHKLMKHLTGVLTSSGPAGFLQALHRSRTRTEDSNEIHRFAPSKRLRGKQYALAHKDRDIRANDGVQDAQISGSDESAETSDKESGDSSVPEAEIDSPLPMETGSDEEETPSPKQTCDDGRYFGIDDKPQSWEDVLGLPFHAFHFNRLVIDEFTYAKTDRLTQLLTLQARSKWVLSGTPPLNDFADVNTIAPFLGVHLGIDADDDNSSQNFRLKEIRKHRSDAETFESFRAPRSEAWHRRRHEIAQTFLDRFARKNVPEIDEIPSTEHVVLVGQSPAEKVIYLELYKQLMTYNRQLKKANGRGGDQAERLDEIIANSSTPEEALLKRCTSLALQGRWDDEGNPEIATCASLIKTREEQLKQTMETLKKKLKLATWLYCSGCDKDHEKFKQFRESVIAHNFGDKPVTEEVWILLDAAIKGSDPDDWRFFYSGSGLPSVSNEEDQDVDEGQNESDFEEEEDEEEYEPAPKPKGRGRKRKAPPKRKAASKPKPKPKPKSKPKPKPKAQLKGKDKLLLPDKPTQPREFDSELRDATANLRKLVSEWVQRKQALRFLTAVRRIQTNQGIPTCDNCQTQPALLSKLNILGSCGHALCANPNCTQLTLEKEECAVEGCRGSGKSFNVINAITLGCDTSSQNELGDTDHSSKHGGTKLDALIDILTTKVPSTERALLFIQFPDLMEIASKALTSAGISHTLITPTDLKASTKVAKFRKDGFGDSKVLILNLGCEMAAGLNLQCANHIIFLSPVLSQTQYDYDSSMIQAIGRSLRYGQTKHVHVYHLIAKMTIDVNIFQERRGNRVLVERDGQAVFVEPEDALKEAMTCQGPTMVADNAV